MKENRTGRLTKVKDLSTAELNPLLLFPGLGPPRARGLAGPYGAPEEMTALQARIKPAKWMGTNWFCWGPETASPRIGERVPHGLERGFPTDWREGSPRIGERVPHGLERGFPTGYRFHLPTQSPLNMANRESKTVAWIKQQLRSGPNGRRAGPTRWRFSGSICS
jgi:hypothetical protein